MNGKRKNIFKSLLSLTLALIMVLGAAPISELVGVDWASFVAPQAEAAKLYSYEVNADGTITITDCASANGAITVPSEIDGKTVTGIGDYAFSECSSITSITLPNGVTSIGREAFYYCTRMTSITLPDSLTSIGSWAFEECSALKSITIPGSVTEIGSCAFYGCTSIKSITLCDGVKIIGDNAFFKCTGATSITIPDSVTSIGKSAFVSCESLKSITIPGSVTSIGDIPFAYCPSLKNINVASENEYYCDKDGVLFNKKQTKLISYPAGKTETKYTIPESVTSIADYAFVDCDHLTDIYYAGSDAKWKAIAIGEYNSGISYSNIHRNHACEETKLITIPAMCEADGMSYYICIECDATVGEIAVIPAGHSWDSGTVTTVATCKSTGIKTYSCTACDTTKTEIIAKDPSNHVGGTTVRNAKATTCTEKGYTGDTCCLGCNEVISKGEDIAATGHGWDSGTVTTVATCKTTGVKTYTCTVCKATKLETIAKDPSNHVGGTTVKNAKAATCTEKGYTGDTCCLGCNEVISKGEDIAATGHGWDSGTVTTAATCKTTGVKTYTCTVCKATKLETIAKDPSNHVGGTTVKDAKATTCTEKGYTGDTCCLGCNEILSKGEDIAATGHNWGKWTTVTEPTVDSEGLEKRVCSECSTEETRAISKLDPIEVTSVNLSESEISLKKGKTFTLIATVEPNDATNKSVTWTSSDESVATVDENGVVTAVSKGTATITATASNGAEASCTVTVKKVSIFEAILNVILAPFRAIINLFKSLFGKK